MMFNRKKPVVKGELYGYQFPDEMASALAKHSETVQRRYSKDARAAEMIRRAVGLAHICCMRNAELCADQTLRLYRIGGEGAGERGRKVSRKSIRTLRSGTAGAKASSMADSSDNLTEITDAEVLDFIKRPNPLFPGKTLETMAFYFGAMAGEFFGIITEERGTRMMWPGYPQYTTVQLGERNLIEKYYFGRNETKPLALDPEFVFHIRNAPSRDNPMRGEGDLIGVLPEQDLLMRELYYALAFVEGGKRPDQLWSVDPATTEEQVKSLTLKIRKWWGDRRNVGHPYVAAGITPHTLTWGKENIDSATQLDRYERMVRTAFGWTESMGNSTEATYAGAKVADGQYGRYIRAKVNGYAAQLTEFVCPLFDLDPTVYFFAYDDPIAGQEKEEEDRYSNLALRGVLTVNEARVALGWEAVDDENADKLLINGRPLAQEPVDPFGGLMGGRSPTNRPKPGEPAVPPKAEPEEPDDGEDEAEAPKPDAKGVTEIPTTFPGEPVNLTKAMLDLEADRWSDGPCPCCAKADDLYPSDLLRRLMLQYAPQVQRVFEDILTDAQDDAVRAAIAGQVPDLSANQQQAVDELLTELSRVVSDGMAGAMEQAGVQPSFDLVPERALEFLRGHTIEIADDIMGTTAEMARTAVQNGLEQGLSIREIQDQISGVPAYRAERIARTEVQFAAQGGKLAGYQEAGITQTKWVTAPGPSAAHAVISSRSPKAIGEPYVRAGETIEGESYKRDIYMPPARPQCRCDLQPVFDDDEEFTNA